VRGSLCDEAIWLSELADVAEQAAVLLAHLSEIERGRKDASSEVLEAICDVLDPLQHRSHAYPDP